MMKWQQQFKLVHRTGRKIIIWLIVSLHVDCGGSIANSRSGWQTGKLQLPWLLLLFFSIPCNHSSAFEQKRTCLIVFVPKQEINQTLYVQQSMFTFTHLCVCEFFKNCRRAILLLLTNYFPIWAISINKSVCVFICFKRRTRRSFCRCIRS